MQKFLKESAIFKWERSRLKVKKIIWENEVLNIPFVQEPF